MPAEDELARRQHAQQPECGHDRDRSLDDGLRPTVALAPKGSGANTRRPTTPSSMATSKARVQPVHFDLAPRV